MNFQIMSIVDRLLADYGMSMDNWEADPDLMAGMINLASELQAHCEEMAEILERNEFSAATCPTLGRWLKFKQEHGQSEDRKT